MKKTIWLLLAACIAAAMLTACSGSASDKPGVSAVASAPPTTTNDTTSKRSDESLTTPATSSEAESVVPMPEGYIGVNGSPIPENAIAVDLNGLGVSNISGMNKLTKVKSLLLFNNDISDISPLGELTAVTELALSGNNISNIEPLRSLNRLTALELSDNNITDISPLAGLTNLKSLHLSGNNEISDISPLKGLTKLDTLYLPNNAPISDVQKQELEAALPYCNIIYGGALGTRPERKYGADLALYTLPFDAFAYTADQLTDGIWVKRGDKFASLNNKRQLLRSLEENVVVVTTGDQIIYKSSRSMPDSIYMTMFDSVGYKFGFGHNRGTVTQIDARSNLSQTEIRTGNRIVSINGNTDLDSAYLSLRGDTAAELRVEVGTSEKVISVVPNLEQLSDYEHVSYLEYTKTDLGYVELDMKYIVMSGNYAFTVDGTDSEIFYFQQTDPLKETGGKSVWALVHFVNHYTSGAYRADVIATEHTVLYGLIGDETVERSETHAVQPETKLHIGGLFIDGDGELIARVYPDHVSDKAYALVLDIDRDSLYIHDGVSGWGSDSLAIVNLPFQPR